MKKFRTKIPDLEFFLYGNHFLGVFATAVNEINVERPLRHIYELGAWLVT
jgi:hypothetical protein